MSRILTVFLTVAFSLSALASPIVVSNSDVQATKVSLFSKKKNKQPKTKRAPRAKKQKRAPKAHKAPSTQKKKHFLFL